MHKTAAEQTQRCQNHFKREYQNVGKAFDQLGRALEQDGNYCKFDTFGCRVNNVQGVPFSAQHF